MSYPKATESLQIVLPKSNIERKNNIADKDQAS